MSLDKEQLKALTERTEIVFGTATTEQIGVVTRLTKTQVVVESEGQTYRFRRADGWEVSGSTFHRRFLHSIDPTKVKMVRDEKKRQRLACALEDIKWRQLGFGVLRDITDVLERHGVQTK